MQHTNQTLVPRRAFLSAAAASLCYCGLQAVNRTHAALAADSAVLDVAYAGSMASVMEGPVKAAVSQQLGLEWHGRAQGSNALARLIVGGNIEPDVFVSITPAPMRLVLKSGKAQPALPVARTEMAIAYSPESRFAAQFEASGTPGETAWWKVLQRPGVRFGRSDPLTDPQGRNIIFTMQLAARLYREPALVERVLGPAINPRQIFPEPTLLARLQSGELDATSAYRAQFGNFKLPFLTLPPEINLGDPRFASRYATAALSLGGKVYKPEPLVYYATVLRGARHPAAADRFVRWLTGPQGQALLHRSGYQGADEVPRLVGGT
ncbi:MAG: extracellular solute-binding protein [Candidatus Eremiobacteraeota bacterium]|nr:extracellular solute-binding protein [Candidatus Eremiobacteraeota bacterium]